MPTDHLTLRRREILTWGATSMAATWAPAAFAQAPASPLPRGQIALVIPFAAGGATDVVGRLVAQKLSERIGRTVIVENAAGGGGQLGATRVARGSADGSLLLMGTVATHAIIPLSTTPTPYDPVRDFTPISLLAKIPNVLCVNKGVPAQNLRELIALLKANPGKYNYATSGVGTPPHLSGELFKSMAKVDIAHVPYKGGGPAMTDVIGGHIPLLFDVLSGAASHIKAGSVRAIAVTTAQRSPSFPDIPTMAEAGLPGYETYTWNAVFGPANVPKPLVDLLSKELQAIANDPETQKRLLELSATPVGSTPAELATLVKAELDKWAPVIKSIGGLKRE